MAAELKITSIMEITGLYTGDEALVKKFTAGDAPVEVVKHSPITGTTGTTIDLGAIAAGSAISIYMEAITGNFYIKLNSTAGDPVLTDSHIYLLEGQHCIIPLNPNATAMAGIRYISDSATGKLLYLLVGK